jgi:pilus assembly protein CpaB
MSPMPAVPGVAQVPVGPKVRVTRGNAVTEVSVAGKN